MLKLLRATQLQPHMPDLSEPSSTAHDTAQMVDQVAPRRMAPPKLLTLFGVLVLWQIIAGVNRELVTPIYNPQLLPPPSAILQAGVELASSGELFEHIAASLGRIVLGVLVATPAAVLAALGVARIRWIENLLEPVIDLLRTLPTLALLPMFILWLGVGETAKVFFIAYGCFFIIFFAAVGAIRAIDPVLLRAGQSLGLRGWLLYRHVILPASLPDIVAGVRFAFSAAAIGIIGSEFVAAQSGLGYLINYSRAFFRVDRMILGAVLLAGIGLVSNYLILAIERALFKWKQKPA